jgi:DNA-binding NtrC family response regulator
MISVVFDPLYPMVEQGQFLAGLFYRLNVVSLEAETR